MRQRPIVEDLFTLDGVDGPRLLISRCRACGTQAFPRRTRCHACGADALDSLETPLDGTIYTWTVIRELGGPRSDFEAYVVAQVDLDSGLRVQGIADARTEAVAIGLRVRGGLTRPYGPDLDPDTVTYCFIPVDGGAP